MAASTVCNVHSHFLVDSEAQRRLAFLPVTSDHSKSGVRLTVFYFMNALMIKFDLLPSPLLALDPLADLLLLRHEHEALLRSDNLQAIRSIYHFNSFHFGAIFNDCFQGNFESRDG